MFNYFFPINTAIKDGMTAIIANLDNLFLNTIFTVFLSLMYVAIGIGVAKKMFLFGNMQTLQTANKLIMTAFISGVVAMIFIPIKAEVTGMLKIETDMTFVKTQVNNGETDRYKKVYATFTKLKEMTDAVRTGIFGILSTLMAISISIAVLRIKFSMGNADVISESRRMMKIAIYGFGVSLAATGIFKFFSDQFLSMGLNNPMLALINTQLEKYEAEDLDLYNSGDFMDKSLYDGTPEFMPPGLISYGSREEKDGAYVTKRIWGIPNEVYSFTKVIEGSDKLTYSKGGFFVAQLPAQGYFMLYVNFGYKASVTTSDGFVVIKVPRRERKDSPFTGKTQGDLIDLSKTNTYPEHAPTCQRILFSSMALPTELENNYEYKYNYRYIGELLNFKDVFGEFRRYNFGITFSEDGEIQKVLKRNSAENIKNGKAVLTTEYQKYTLTQDRTRQLEQEIQYDKKPLPYYVVDEKFKKDSVHRDPPSLEQEAKDARDVINQSIDEDQRGVVLYEAANYGGREVWLFEGQYPDLSSKDFRNKASSFKIMGAGVKFTYWKESNFGGANRTSTSDIPHLGSYTIFGIEDEATSWNDDIVSCQVTLD